jgi:hypothetical protein
MFPTPPSAEMPCSIASPMQGVETALVDALATSDTHHHLLHHQHPNTAKTKTVSEEPSINATAIAALKKVLTKCVEWD